MKTSLFLVLAIGCSSGLDKRDFVYKPTLPEYVPVQSESPFATEEHPRPLKVAAGGQFVRPAKLQAFARGFAPDSITITCSPTRPNTIFSLHSGTYQLTKSPSHDPNHMWVYTWQDNPTTPSRMWYLTCEPSGDIECGCGMGAVQSGGSIGTFYGQGDIPAIGSLWQAGATPIIDPGVTLQISVP